MNAITSHRSHPALAGTLGMLGLVLGAFSISLWAQPSGAPVEADWERGASPMSKAGRGPGGPPPGGHPLLMLFDSDQDGVISATEIDGAVATLLSMDTDGDGTVSDRELVDALPPPPDHRMGRLGGREGPPPGADF
ncbi:MAG: hypothetical protein HOH58_08440 [Opitutaceae bacterium]|nr:hypothetical protein [Opitutaceae bacterium]